MERQPFSNVQTYQKVVLRKLMQIIIILYFLYTLQFLVRLFNYFNLLTLSMAYVLSRYILRLSSCVYKWMCLPTYANTSIYTQTHTYVFAYACALVCMLECLCMQHLIKEFLCHLEIKNNQPHVYHLFAFIILHLFHLFYSWLERFLYCMLPSAVFG